MESKGLSRQMPFLYRTYYLMPLVATTTLQLTESPE